MCFGFDFISAYKAALSKKKKLEKKAKEAAEEHEEAVTHFKTLKKDLNEFKTANAMDLLSEKKKKAKATYEKKKEEVEEARSDKKQKKERRKTLEVTLESLKVNLEATRQATEAVDVTVAPAQLFTIEEVSVYTFP